MHPSTAHRRRGQNAFRHPCSGKQRQGINQRSEMVSVGEETDGFGRIGEGEETQRTGRTLSDLDQSHEHAEDADSEDHEAQ